MQDDTHTHTQILTDRARRLRTDLHCPTPTSQEMAMSAATGGHHQHGGTVKQRRWGGLRQQWKLLGLFQIDQQHEFYSLTCMMKEGLAAAIQSSIDNAPTRDVSDDDFRVVVTQIHKVGATQCVNNSVQSIFGAWWIIQWRRPGPVFASLRGSLGITEQEYQQSLCSENCYLQFISNSKSKADFFLTNDKRFFLKTQNKREMKFLLANLKIYMEHLRTYPHSLLVKFLGVHRINIPHRLKKYFIVMQNVSYPDDRISARYDIKGCEVSRWTEPAPEGSQIIVVLKDLNFEGQYITLDRERPWLLRQMEIDTQFLRRLNVLDYSLLLAHQPLHHDERHQSLSFATLITRTKKSLNPGSSPIYAAITIVPGAVREDEFTLHEANNSCLKQPQAGDASSSSTLPISPKLLGPGSGPAELRDLVTQNRRLLPNVKNPLHVIDGPEQRYFIGIIDIFTVYSFKKRLEQLWKTLRYPGRSFSTVSPQTYCLRLCQWLEDHTK
uniref:phosphatidylinositol 4-phosphate 5-kinase-like protein 1 n=1 Tax=Monopterus albus TaxID=43700 RepID=UPI0009B3A036|nr:phosphatidylinositol 4-phosphate 5-kinase-like protein 1 [Monopterus albus]